MEINLQPRKETLDARNIVALIELHLQDKQGRRTRGTYTYLLSLFTRWWNEYAPANNHELSADACREYVAWLATTTSSQSQEPFAFNTQSKALSAFRALLRWAYQGGYIPKDFSHWVKQPKGEPRTIPAPSPEVLMALMDAATTLQFPRRNQAILATFIGTGIRRSEAAALDIEDLQFDASGAGTMLIRKGKGGKQRTVIFDAITGSYLLAYIDRLPKQKGPLFIGQRGRLQPTAVYQVVRKCALISECHKQIKGPHDLRRLFATHWTRHQRSIGSAQLLSLQLGHSDPQQTIRYSRPTLDDVGSAFTAPWTASG